jgi:hypothetical protein
MTQTITYRFFAPNHDDTAINLQFDDERFRLQLPENPLKPDWAKLSYQKCSNCPLTDDVEWCPAALAFAQVLPRFKQKFSYEKTIVEVETTLRTVVSKSTFQTGVASLFGLACATSGCPKTMFLRPLARFHLPFANEQETVFRTLATNLLIQYFNNSKNGENKPLNFDALNAHYAELNIVNSFLAERLRVGVERDAALNAVMILDGFAYIAPDNTDGSFEDIRDIFTTE